MNKRTWTIVIALFFMIGFRFLPGLAGLNANGMLVLGVLIGAIILWLTNGLGWTSILVISALMTAPFLKGNDAITTAFGNWIFPFLICSSLVIYVLGETPFLKRCGVFFMTTRIARKGPWFFLASFFFAVLFVGCFMSPSIAYVIFLPIAESLCQMINEEKGGKIGKMLLMGIVFCCSTAAGMTPIGHVFPLVGLGIYESMTGNTIGYMQYMTVAVPAGIIIAALMVVLFWLVLRPDASKFEQIDYEKLKKSLPAMDKREILSIVISLGMVALWLLPDAIKNVLPGLSSWLGGRGTAWPAMVACVCMCILTVDGTPLLDFETAMKRAIPWGGAIMICATNILGSAITNADSGLSDWISGIMSPMLGGVSSIGLLVILLLWVMIQTNVSSNIVAVTVVTSIGLPLAMTSNASLSAAGMAVCIGAMGSFAYATPPAHGIVALGIGTGWAEAKDFLKYGLLLGLLAVVTMVCIAYPISTIVF